MMTSETFSAMSDSAAHTPPSSDDAQFDRDEVRQFEADDTEAGRAIGKMLSLFFLYTVMVMALSTYVTIRWVYRGG